MAGKFLSIGNILHFRVTHTHTASIQKYYHSCEWSKIQQCGKMDYGKKRGTFLETCTWFIPKKIETRPNDVFGIINDAKRWCECRTKVDSRKKQLPFRINRLHPKAISLFLFLLRALSLYTTASVSLAPTRRMDNNCATNVYKFCRTHNHLQNHSICCWLLHCNFFHFCWFSRQREETTSIRRNVLLLCRLIRYKITIKAKKKINSKRWNLLKEMNGKML